MKRRLKELISIVLALMIILYAMPEINAAEVNFNESTDLIAIKGEAFIVITYNEKYFEMYRLTRSGINKFSAESMPANQAYYTSDMIYLLCQNSRNIPFIAIGDGGAGGDVGIISDVLLKENCFAAIDIGYIYLVDAGSPNTVCKYTPKGIKTAEFNLNSEAGAVFTYSTGSEEIVYAVTSDGILDLESDIFISCASPESPFQFYGDYCCDSNGWIFYFDTEKGFTSVLKTDYENVYIVNGSYYGMSGKTIYRLDDNGSPIAKYEFETEPKKVCASGSLFAALYSNDVYLIYESEFLEIITESAVDSSENTSLSPSDSSTENSKNSLNKSSEVSAEINSISSDKYILESNIISNIPQGTTIAVLKSNIDYGTSAVTFINHNGKTVTSGQIGTGWQVTFTQNSTSKTYFTVVTGDVTGEGNINSRDTSALSNYLLFKSDLSEYAYYAADLNGDGEVNSLDLLLTEMLINR